MGEPKTLLGRYAEPGIRRDLMNFDQKKTEGRGLPQAQGSTAPNYDYRRPSVSGDTSAAYSAKMASQTSTPSIESGITGAKPSVGERHHFSFRVR